MTLSEQEIEVLEEQFTSLSARAFSAACKETLASGLSVLVAEEDTIYEIFPDGTRIAIKNIDPPTRNRRRSLLI